MEFALQKRSERRLEYTLERGLNLTNTNTKDREVIYSRSFLFLFVMRYWHLFIFIIFPYFLSAQVQLQFKSGDTPVANLGFQATACDQNKGYTTDPEGKASVVLPANCSSLRLQFQDITYGNLDTVFTITSPTQAILIPLTERQLTIDEVRVAGYASNIKEDARGREYKINAEKFQLNTPIPKALWRLPDFVKSGENSVTIAGKSSVPTYYLDGKPVSEKIIQSLNIQEVDRVVVHEVAADPEKDAGGEIYIYRKKRTDRFLYGDLSASGMQQLNTERLGYTAYSTIGFQSPKFEVNALAQYRRTENNWKVMRSYFRTGLQDSVIKLIDQSSAIQTLATLQMNYAFTEKFSAQVAGDFSRYDSNRKRKTRDNSYSNKYHSDDLQASGTLVLEYDYNTDNRFYLMGSYDYTYDLYHLWERTRDFPLKQNEQSIAGEFRAEHDELGTLWSVGHDLEYAYRFISRRGTSDGMLTPTSQAQRVTLEDVMRFPFPLSLYLGCSLDYDRYDYGIKQLDMWHLLPMANISYGGEWGRLGASYRYRVQKPSIGYLDPRPRYSDRQNAFIGNPDLQAATSHSYTLSYSKRFGLHALSLRFSYSTYDNLVVSLYSSSDFISQYFNAGRRQSFTPFLFYQGQFLDRIFVNLYGGVTYVAYNLYDRYKALSRGKEQKGWTPMFNVNFEYEIVDRLSASIWFANMGSSYSLYTYQSLAPDLSLSLDYTFLEDRSLVLSAYANALLSPWLKNSYRRELYNFVETSETQGDPIFSLSVSYSFGRRFQSRISGTSIDTSDDQLDRIK